AELSQLIDELAVVLRAPVEPRIHETPIEADVTLGPGFVSVDLSMHQSADRALDRRHLAKRLLDGRDLVGTSRLRDLAAETEQETHLRPIAHIRLMIAEAMARRLDVDVAREHGIVVHEDFLPRHLDVVAQNHAVALVVAPGERGIEL